MIHDTGGAILAGGGDEGPGVGQTAGQEGGRAQLCPQRVLSENRALIGRGSRGFQGEPPDLPGPCPHLGGDDSSARLTDNAGGSTWHDRAGRLARLFPGYSSVAVAGFVFMWL